MKNALLIVNPKSGRGMVSKHLLDVINHFSAKGIFVTTYITQSKSDAFRTAKREAGNYDMIVCSGGDGTLDEVVSGIAKSGYLPKIGYIPAGSTNDFAHSLELPTEMSAAARVVVDGHPFACDIGTFNDWYFVYVAAFGAFTEVSYSTNQDMKNILGHMAYIIEGAKSIFDIKPYHMRFVIDDERELEGDFLFGMICNSESVGGVSNITGNDIELDDGLFEVILVRKPESPLDWQPIIGGLLSRKSDDKFIYYMKAKKVHFECDEDVSWTLDGEDGGIRNEGDIVVHEKMIEIMVDEEYIKKIHGEKEEASPEK